MNITEKQIKRYEDLIEHNGYSELLLSIAEDFKLNYFVKLFESILVIHLTEGHLSLDVMQVRERFKDEMMQILESELSTDDFKVISRFI